ncbi:MAG: SDR family oxidoreductase [Nitrosomonadales bacterium]|nr:SDR family oxidoreductase [Nitrosomonadales bacterium]
MNTLLITGANRGIGLEFCKQYAADGWRVLACCRDPGKADALNRLAAQYPDLIKLHALDVTNHAQIEQLARTLSEETIDLLINDAGVYPDAGSGGFGHTDYEKWMAAFNINTMAPLKMVEAFVNQIARSQFKLIVTITSQMGSMADNSSGGSYLYRSSKAAANMVVKSLAVDLKEKGITSVAFNPGWVKTDMGGPNAMIAVEQSVADMRKVIAGLTLADTGKFIGNDGLVIPW